ncbi:MAG TPA: hypothetical protein PK509_15230 [Catalimonadaceae bacterium]|nr:hypothetical protein [Catalimonadaceae bacterium]HPI11142.1 hypothetical protein [Catalimonadaceae bacterium]
MQNFQIQNLGGEKFAGNSIRDVEAVKDLVRIRIDTYSKYFENYKNFDIHFFRKLLKLQPIPIWVGERSIADSKPISIWRSSILKEEEYSAEDFPISRFYHRPPEMKKTTELGRCNKSGQIIFYGAESGLVSYAETIDSFTKSQKEALQVGIAKWGVKKNLMLAVVGNFEEMEKHEELRELRSAFLNAQMGDELKDLLLKWHVVLGTLFAIEDKRVYRLTSMLANYFFSNQHVDGLIYPSVKFSRLLKENNTDFQPGFNYAILPGSLQMNESIQMELCSIYDFVKVDANSVKSEVVRRHNEINILEGLIKF